MKTLEQLAKEAGHGVSLQYYGTLPDGTNQFLGAKFTTEALARFRALCMEEAAQIANRQSNFFDGDISYRDGCYDCEEAIRASIKA